MTDKELRRLSRAELLEMLLMLKEENENLKMQLKQAEAQLQNRRIMIKPEFATWKVKNGAVKAPFLL